MARRLPLGRGPGGRARRRRAGAPEPGRHAARAATGRRSATSRHVDTVLADAEDWTRRPVGRRDPRRLPLRPRRDRHEEPDGRRGRRRRPPRPHAAPGSSGTLKVISVADEETGGALGAKWITEERPDLVARRLPAQRGRRARSCPTAIAACTASAWPRRARSASTSTRAAPPRTPPCPAWPRNALLELAPLIVKLGEGRPGYRPDRGDRARCSRRSARTRPTRARRSSASRADRAAARAAARRRDERHVRADDRVARARRSTSSRRAPRCASTAASRRGWARTPRSSASARCSATTATSSSSPRRSPATARRCESPLMDAIGDWVGEHDPGAEAVPIGPARVHRLPLVPRRVPGLRRLRLLPAAPPDASMRPGR